MPRVPPGKVRLEVYIDKRLAALFRRYIMMKYSQYRKGYLSYEVQEAIRFYLIQQGFTLKQLEEEKIPETVNRLNPPPRVRRVYRYVVEYVKSKYGDIDQTTKKHIEEALSTKFISKITIRRYLELFEKYGLIKKIGGKVYELVG